MAIEKSDKELKKEKQIKNVKAIGIGYLVLLIIIIIFSLLLFFFSGMERDENNQTQQIDQTQQEDVKVVFDVKSLYGKNIEEVRAVLGDPIGEYINPTAEQIELGAWEWSNAWDKDNYQLSVNYVITSKEVIDFFLATNDPSGATKDIEKLKKISNLENQTLFMIEPVEAKTKKGFYTGIIIKPFLLTPQ